MTGAFRLFFDNPLLVRELRRRMRGQALLSSVILYIIVMSVVVSGIMLVNLPHFVGTPTVEMLRRMRNVGEALVWSVTAIQALLVLFAAPMITAGLTTTEKEMGTFDFLRVTTITRWMYVMGCFLSSAFYVTLALLCALPMLGLGFLYGGVSLENLTLSYALLFGGSWVLSSFGLYVSSVTEKTRSSQGIVAFSIFGMIIASFFLFSLYQAMFVGMGGAGPGGVHVLSVLVPTALFVIVAAVAVSLLFLLLAARKLFEPEETRSLGHLQFLILTIFLLGLGVALLMGNAPVTEYPEAMLLGLMLGLSLMAVAIFGVGRMEVGDEIWHLKRIVPAARWVDPSLPFFIALLGIFWSTIWFFRAGLWTPVVMAEAVTSFAWVVGAFLALMVAVARAFTASLPSTTKAWQATFGVMIMLLFIVPIVALTISSASGLMLIEMRELACVSPLTVLYYMVTQGLLFKAAPGVLPIGQTAAMATLTLALVVAMVGERKRIIRWRGFDYHYDMPQHTP